MAPQFPERPSLKKIQYATGPPELSHTLPLALPCVTVRMRHGRPRGPKVAGEVAVLASVGVTVVVEGRSCDAKVEVLGAVDADCGATSELIAITGSPAA